MSEADALDYLETELCNRIHNFGSSRKFYRSSNNAVILATSTLSALATVLIGMNQKWINPWISVVAMVCSAGTTVVAAYDGFLRSRDLWILNNDTWVALMKLQSHILYCKKRASGPLSQQEIDAFFAHYDQLLMHHNLAWRALRTIRDHEPPSREAPKQSREDPQTGNGR